MSVAVPEGVTDIPKWLRVLGAMWLTGFAAFFVAALWHQFTGRGHEPVPVVLLVLFFYPLLGVAAGAVIVGVVWVWKKVLSA